MHHTYFLVEEWIKCLKVIFDYMGVQDVGKIKCASFLFKREAKHLWEMAKLNLNLERMTWTKFKTLFFSKYFTYIIHM